MPKAAELTKKDCGNLESYDKQAMNKIVNEMTIFISQQGSSYNVTIMETYHMNEIDLTQ